MNIKPGDLFQWVYKYGNSPVVKNEELYSHKMEKYVPCSELCLCIGLSDVDIFWVSKHGVFYTHLDKIRRSLSRRRAGRVIPCKIQQ
jgi:hypothetical protein